MILTGSEIKKRLGSDIIINPFSNKQLNPNSYNLKLHNELLIYNTDSLDLDMKRKNSFDKFIIPENGLKLRPNQLYLGRTVEHTETHNLIPCLEGRSSVARLGMFVHITAGFGDIGFSGYWTLELSVIQPLVIYPNIEICQIFYHTVLGDIIEYNSGKYQNNTGIQESKLYRDFEK